MNSKFLLPIFFNYCFLLELAFLLTESFIRSSYEFPGETMSIQIWRIFLPEQKWSLQEKNNLRTTREKTLPGDFLPREKMSVQLLTVIVSGLETWMRDDNTEKPCLICILMTKDWYFTLITWGRGSCSSNRLQSHGQDLCTGKHRTGNKLCQQHHHWIFLDE